MKKYKCQLLKLFLVSFYLILLLILTSCSDDFLSNIYYGYLNDGTEETISSGQSVELKQYKKFKYPTLDDIDIKSETLILFEFDFYSDLETTIELILKWEYSTTVFNISNTKTLTSISFETTGDSLAQAVSIELSEDDYFVIKNNKKQYLIIEIRTEDNMNCYINRPSILTLTDDDEKALEDEFDIETGDEVN